MHHKKILHSKILGQGRPLLILHGFLGLSDNWLRLAKRWALDGFAVHLIDLRNHGQSFWDDEFNYDVLVQDLVEYIEHHKLQKPDLLGHSLGGKILMFDAIRNPENRGNYIVADIAPKAYPVQHQYIFDAIKKIKTERLKSREEARRILEEKIKDKFLSGFLLKNLKRTSVGFRWQHNWEVLEENMTEIGEALPPFSVSHARILFLQGENSNYIEQQDYPWIRAHFPNAQIKRIPQAGHLIHIDNPEETYWAVKNFLLSSNLR